MDLTLIIPAFDERERIVATLRSATEFLESRRWSFEIVVVDDGSSDGMAALVEEFARANSHVRLLQNDRNRGKGFSVRHGVTAASGDIMGFIDADNKTGMDALDGAMALLASGCDGVIGDRSLAESRVEVPRRRYRQWGSELFRLLLRHALGLGAFPDTQCGFKFFRAAVMRDLFERQRIDGYMFDVEILLLARRSDYDLRQLPVRWRDDPDSRFNPLWSSVRNVIELARIVWSHR